MQTGRKSFAEVSIPKVESEHLICVPKGELIFRPFRFCDSRLWSLSPESPFAPQEGDNYIGSRSDQLWGSVWNIPQVFRTRESETAELRTEMVVNPQERVESTLAVPPPLPPPSGPSPLSFGCFSNRVQRFQRKVISFFPFKSEAVFCFCF